MMETIVVPATALSTHQADLWRLLAPMKRTNGLFPTETTAQYLFYVIQMAVAMERTIERPRPIVEDGSNRYVCREAGNQAIDRLCRGHNFSEEARMGPSTERRQ
jgi:hypothetical protein